MVGAANSPNSASGQHGKRPNSNHGNRVDCNAWGDSVVTTDWDGSTPAASYFDDYGATSAASAIIAGAAVSVQGMCKQNRGMGLKPGEMRALFSTKTLGTEVGKIGVMPDLAEVIKVPLLGLTPDLFIRDFVGDTGDSGPQALSQSPDIIVRESPAADPAVRYGPGNPAASGILPANVQGVGDHYVYVRVSNRGAMNACNVKARVYWSETSTLADPTSWNLIGETTAWHAGGLSHTTDNVLAGETLAVSEPIVWHGAGVDPGPGHYCFIAIAESALDPLPTPTSLGDYDAFVQFVRDNNNVAWRNFNIVNTLSSFAPPAGLGEFNGLGAAMEFKAAGALDRNRTMRLEIVGGLPAGSQLWLGVPPDLAARLGIMQDVLEKTDGSMFGCRSIPATRSSPTKRSSNG